MSIEQGEPHFGLLSVLGILHPGVSLEEIACIMEKMRIINGLRCFDSLV